MRFITITILLSIIAITTTPYIGFSEDLTTKKEAAIVKLLEVTGSKNISLQMENIMNQNIANALKSGNPEIPDRAFQILSEEIKVIMAQNVDSLFSTIILIYHTHFSKAEIDELIVFYETKIGKKTISVLPKIVNESMLAGQK